MDRLIYTAMTGARHTFLQQAGVASEFALRAAYREFVENRFGVEATWLAALWSEESRTERMARDLAPLRDLLAVRSRGLDPLQRLVLSRTTRLLAMRLPEDGDG